MSVSTCEKVRFDNLTGHTIGKYRVGNFLAQGGGGCVYRLERLEGGNVGGGEVVKAFDLPALSLHRVSAEGQYIQSLVGVRGVVRCRSFGEYQGIGYQILEKMPGANLLHIARAFFRAKRGFTHAEALSIFLETCCIMSGIEQQRDSLYPDGKYHGDIKLSNLHLFDDGLTLFDFYVAANRYFFQPELTVGTNATMAPETFFNPYAHSVRSDIYSAGAMLYILLTGKMPFPRERSLPDFLEYRQWAPFPMEGFPPFLFDLYSRVVSIKPEQRWPYFATVVDETERIMRLNGLTLVPMHEVFSTFLLMQISADTTSCLDESD
ncbi:MAG: hypothetical protein WC901_00225 [Candidatus Margulisiibacteriota bacterium]